MLFYKKLILEEILSETLTLLPHEYPDTSQMILEDDEPLDSFINEKQQRLLIPI